MDTKKNEQKKFLPLKDYRPEIGEALINEAEREGNPACFIQAKFNLSDKAFSSWPTLAFTSAAVATATTSWRKSGVQEHFLICYKEFKRRRRDFLDKIAINGKINEKIWACLTWSQLSEKINPPKEITCEADVKTTMKVEDLNTIIEKLEGKKNSIGF